MPHRFKIEGKQLVPEKVFKTYRRAGFVEARPYVIGEDLSTVAVTPSDAEYISGPNKGHGGYIMRTPELRQQLYYVGPIAFGLLYEGGGLREVTT